MTNEKVQSTIIRLTKLNRALGALPRNKNASSNKVLEKLLGIAERLLELETEEVSGETILVLQRLVNDIAAAVKSKVLLPMQNSTDKTGSKIQTEITNMKRNMNVLVISYNKKIDKSYVPVNSGSTIKYNSSSESDEPVAAYEQSESDSEQLNSKLELPVFDSPYFSDDDEPNNSLIIIKERPISNEQSKQAAKSYEQPDVNDEITIVRDNKHPESKSAVKDPKLNSVMPKAKNSAITWAGEKNVFEIKNIKDAPLNPSELAQLKNKKDAKHIKVKMDTDKIGIVEQSNNTPSNEVGENNQIKNGRNKPLREILVELQQHSNHISSVLPKVTNQIQSKLDSNEEMQKIEQSLQSLFKEQFEDDFDEEFAKYFEDELKKDFLKNNAELNEEESNLKLSKYYADQYSEYRQKNRATKWNDNRQERFNNFYQKNILSVVFSKEFSKNEAWKQAKSDIGNILYILSSIHGANLTSEQVQTLQKLVWDILNQPAIQQFVEFAQTTLYSNYSKKSEEINFFLSQISSAQKVMNEIITSYKLYSQSDKGFLNKTIHEILSSADDDKKLSSLLALADHLDSTVGQVLGSGKAIANQKKSASIEQGDIDNLVRKTFRDTLGFEGKLNRIEYLAISAAIVPVIAELSGSDKSGYMIANKINNGLRYLGTIAGSGRAVRPAVKSEYNEVNEKIPAATTALKNFVSKQKNLVDRFATAIGLKRVDEPLKNKHKVIVGAIGVGGVIGAAVVVIGGGALAVALAVPKAVGIVGGIIAAGVVVGVPPIAAKVVSVIKSGISGLTSLLGKKPAVMIESVEENVTFTITEESMPTHLSVAENNNVSEIRNEIDEKQRSEEIIIPDNRMKIDNDDHDDFTSSVDSEDDNDELNASADNIPQTLVLPKNKSQSNKFGEENQRSEALDKLNKVASGFFEKHDKSEITTAKEGNDNNTSNDVTKPRKVM